MPDLKGKIAGMAMRVPTPSVSIVDLAVQTERPATVEAVNTAFTRYSETSMRGILSVSDEALVSTDLRADPHSAISVDDEQSAF